MQINYFKKNFKGNIINFSKSFINSVKLCLKILWETGILTNCEYLREIKLF